MGSVSVAYSPSEEPYELRLIDYVYIQGDQETQTAANVMARVCASETTWERDRPATVPGADDKFCERRHCHRRAQPGRESAAPRTHACALAVASRAS